MLGICSLVIRAHVLVIAIIMGLRRGGKSSSISSLLLRPGLPIIDDIFDKYISIFIRFYKNLPKFMKKFSKFSINHPKNRLNMFRYIVKIDISNLKLRINLNLVVL